MFSSSFLGIVTFCREILDEKQIFLTILWTSGKYMYSLGENKRNRRKILQFQLFFLGQNGTEKISFVSLLKN